MGSLFGRVAAASKTFVIGTIDNSPSRWPLAAVEGVPELRAESVPFNNVCLTFLARHGSRFLRSGRVVALQFGAVGCEDLSLTLQSVGPGSGPNRTSVWGASRCDLDGVRSMRTTMWLSDCHTRM